MKKSKKKFKGKSGITLVALVVTIVVMLILAGVSLNFILGEQGIIRKTVEAAEKTEIARIKEEADLLKTSLLTDEYTGGEKVTKLLLSSTLNDYFKDSTIENGRVVVNKGKYDIVIKNNLDIVVVKHGENYLEDDEIGINYEIAEIDKHRSKIKVYLEVAGASKTYEEYSNEYLANKSREELEELFLKSIGYIGAIEQWETDNNTSIEEEAQNAGMTYEEFLRKTLSIEAMNKESWVYVEYVVYLAGGEGKNQTELENLYVELVEYPGTFDNLLAEENITRDKFLEFAQSNGFRTEEDCVKCFIAEYYIQNNIMITVACSNGETVTKNPGDLYVEFTLEESGSYTITATTESGKRGDVTVTVRLGEKFSAIYTKTEEYVDANGDRAIIPEGYAVGKSKIINSIEKGLVITDSVDNYGNSNGNEWVWVQVDASALAGMYETASTPIAITGGSGKTYISGVETSKYSKSGIISGDYGTRGLPNSTNDREPDVVVGSKGTSYDAVESNRATAGFTKKENEITTTMTLSEMAKTMVNEYETMLASIKKYGGFYIGRYELTANGEKPGATLTNRSWYTLYGECKKLEASEKVQTRMIWGCQWDVTCNWIASTNEDKSITDSRSWGNYKDSIAPANTGNYEKGVKKDTGSNEAWRANNIYDFAGNCEEWIQEAGNTFNRASRGGSYSGNGSLSPATYRYGCGPTSSDLSVLRFPSHFNSATMKE